VDRLLRALSGDTWAARVLADVVPAATTQDLRMRILNEMRAVAEAPSGIGRGPLAEHYTELLKRGLTNLTEAQGTGAWRTAVYLAGDVESYDRLAGVWRGVYSGPASSPEPIRVLDTPAVTELVQEWALPDEGDDDPPGLFRHPFTHQTLLTSAQLAAYIHLPRLETRGFAIRLVPDFDAVPAPVVGDRLRLGRIVERDQASEVEFVVGRDQLTGHAFVTGVTGSGKTNTIFQLVTQAAAADIPFLVIEPTKTEYRSLLETDVMGEALSVFTLGNELVAPFRLNPFEFPAGIPVGVHLDLLRSVFNVSFGMWTPLPQVLEVCLHEVYADRGWDVATNANYRLESDDDRWMAFPTISELLAKVEDVVDDLGYDEEVTSDIRAALKTRLNSLRSGAKGRMLDVQRSVDMSELLGSASVLELEGLGDDDDKAFVMALLIARLAEERRVRGESPSLRHLLVVEEAHRVLANPEAPRGEYEADARGKAVETFANLLSEVRAYGQGVVIVDQIASKMAPDVVKNTSLKIAHRVVAGDDRLALGAAMAMSDRQQLSLATLSRGRAAVFVDGEDVPLLVQVDRVEAKARGETLSDDRVRAAATHRAATVGLSDCRASCGEETAVCWAARQLVEDEAVQRTFGRIVLSSLFDEGALERLWPELQIAIEPLRPPWVASDTLLRAVGAHASHWLADRRGAQRGWNYGNAAGFAEALSVLMAAQAAVADTSAAAQLVEAALRPLEGPLSVGPFPACDRIWDGERVPCRCRFPVSDLVGTGAFDEEWDEAVESDDEAGGVSERWNVCQEAAYVLTEFPEDDWPAELRSVVGANAVRVALCVGQQLLAADPDAHPRSIVREIERLEDEAFG
jgi:DNA helicase HerA-like ATPase